MGSAVSAKKASSRGVVGSLGLGCWLFLLPSASAGEQARSVPQEQRYFTLNQFGAYLELESEFNQTRVRYDDRGRLGGDARQTNRDWGVQERLGFNLAGTVVRPSFISYRGDFSFALTQDHFDEHTPLGDQSDREWGSLSNYDFRVNLLQGQAISGSVYGLRVDDRLPRRFQTTLRERRSGFGTAWYFADERLPMELTYDYLETDRTGNDRNRDDEHFTDSVLHYGLQRLISAHHNFKLSYDHSNRTQEYQGSSRSFETTRDLWTFDHHLGLGDEQEHELRTLIHWQEESGDFARDLFEFGPQLTLQHADNLQTSYKYQFNREEYEQFRLNQHRADFQVVHQLYNNLTTTGNIFGLYEKVEDDIETYQYGASADWQYTRANPYGQLDLDLALAFDNEHVRGDNGLRLVLNESGAFRDPIAVTLVNRNVVHTSILVTDSSNRRIYLRGIDYVVIRQGEWTRLIRVRSGRIVDGETVLIDYRHETPSDGRIDTVRVDVGVEQHFSNGLTPYYHFDYRNQEVEHSTGFAVGQDRTDHHRVGAKFERQRFSLGAEYEVFDDFVEPYDALHTDGRYSLLRTAEQSLEGSLRFSRFFFEGGLDDRNVTLLDMELDHRWYFNDSLSATSRALYRWEKDSVDGNTNGVDLSAALSYKVGELSVEVSIEYDVLDLPRSKEDGFSAWITVRRDFADLFAPR